MRFGWVAAAAAMVAAVPAGAATIVQYDSEGVFRGFTAFDTRLGKLTSATLDIAVDKSRAWRVDAPLPVGSTKSIDWTVNGIWSLNKAYTGAADDLLLPLIGSGTSNVVLSNAIDGGAFGYFAVTAKASTTISLDASRVTRGSPFFFDGVDRGYHDAVGADTLFTVSGANRLTRLAGACFPSGNSVFAPSEDLCGSARYTLTYNYEALEAVPEPATWAMMLIGFGAVGGAMRRRRSAPALATS